MTVYTLQEATALLKISERKFRSLLSDGKIKGFRIGRVWRFTDEELIRFIKQEMGREGNQEV